MFVVSFCWSYNLQHWASICTEPGQIVTHLFKSRSAFNLSSFVLSVLWAISKNSFNVKFLPMLFPLNISPFSSQPPNSLRFMKFPLLSSPGHTSGVSQSAAQSAFLPSAMSALVTLFHSNCILSVFSYAAHSSLWATSLFGLPIFRKCHKGLSLGHKEATQLHAWLPVCGPLWSGHWPINDPQNLRSEEMSPDRDVHLLLHSDLWTKELVANLYFIHSLTLNVLW